MAIVWDWKLIAGQIHRRSCWNDVKCKNTMNHSVKHICEVGWRGCLDWPLLQREDFYGCFLNLPHLFHSFQTLLFFPIQAKLSASIKYRVLQIWNACYDMLLNRKNRNYRVVSSEHKLVWLNVLLLLHYGRFLLSGTKKTFPSLRCSPHFANKLDTFEISIWKTQVSLWILTVS